MSRILVGYDGSEGADQAVTLVGNLPWSPDTVIRLATAVLGVRELRSAWGHLIHGHASDIERDTTVQAEAALSPARARLSDSGLTLESTVVTGRPAQALVEEARRSEAILIVVGWRGLGPISSTVLGSVSTEVIDIAPCPVLVARSPWIRGILFATDGSRHAYAAERFLAKLPIAREVPVRVVSTAEVFRPWTIGIAPTMYRQAIAAQAEQEAYARQTHSEIASASATRLAGDGIDARAEVRVGDPAAEVLAVADVLGADLIVLGSRGQTRLRRLILGSVARRVLQHASASVLVVRAGTAAVDPPARPGRDRRAPVRAG